MVLASGAGLTVFYARQAFRAQSKQLCLLQVDTERQQADDIGLTWSATANVTILTGADVAYNSRSVIVVENRSRPPTRDVTCRFASCEPGG